MAVCSSPKGIHDFVMSGRASLFPKTPFGQVIWEVVTNTLRCSPMRFSRNSRGFKSVCPNSMDVLCSSSKKATSMLTMGAVWSSKYFNLEIMLCFRLCVKSHGRCRHAEVWRVSSPHHLPIFLSANTILYGDFTTIKTHRSDVSGLFSKNGPPSGEWSSASEDRKTVHHLTHVASPPCLEYHITFCASDRGV
jgi:hypothetical protein